MPERTIELTWRCASCGTKGILGRHKACPECASPREKGEMNMDGLDTDVDGDGFNDAATVTAPELLDLAQAGYDWFCTHCESGNRGDGSECSNCGSPRYGEKKELHPDLLPPKPKPAPAPPPEPDEEPAQDPRKRHVQGFLVFVALALFALLVGVWAFSTHDVTGTTAKMEWERKVTVDAWSPKTERAWRHRASERTEVKPVNGGGERAGYALIPGSCREEHYEDQQYQCGTREERYDCSTSHTESYQATCQRSESYTCGETCSSQGNGFAKCRPKNCSRSVSYSCTKTRQVKDPKTCTRDVPKYCTRPIYRDKCDYLTQEWVKVREPVLSGQGKNMAWPDVTLLALERARRSSTYGVTWTYKDKGKLDSFQRVLSESDYLGWNVGQPVYMKVTRMGTVSEFSATRLP